MSDGRTHYADDETIAHIVKLEAENARLRDVLEKIADGQDGTGWRIQATGYAENVQRMARAALTKQEGGEDA